MNDTLKAFDYPASLVREYQHWVVLLRPKQITLGALVLACKENVEAFPAISPDAFIELKEAVIDIERALKRRFAYDKINYLMLMMVDRQVHFHVVPRYAGARDFAGVSATDPGWPKQPDMAAAVPLSEAQLRALRDELRAVWAA
ncbi:MAG: HIT family protein [Alphaproteobacteria bacterium]|nr:HIT family protein [Alphaproteobacteria bacterium]